MKSILLILLTSVSIAGCTPSTSLKPDEVLLDQSKNNLGESPKSIEDLISAPKERPFRIQDLKNLEDLITSQQRSTENSREAIYIGKDNAKLLSGPFSASLAAGGDIQPGANLKIFWPPDVVNDYIRVKNGQDGESWLLFRDSNSNPQVILLEDFIVPQVALKDSKLIVISGGDAASSDTTLVVADEEVKPIPKIDIDLKSKEEPVAKGDSDEDGDQALPIVVDINPNDDVFDDTIKPIEDKPPVDDVATEPVDTDEPTKGGSPQISLRPKQRPSAGAPVTSLRPKQRPTAFNTDLPPLDSAKALSAEELLDSLGISAVKVVSKETTYLSNGKRNIGEVFHRAHKSFSACTFNPAQGPSKSKCYRELILSEEFTDFLGGEGLSCAKKAAKLIFDKEPLKVLLRTNGGSVNRGNSRSLHHRGRALDVFKVYLYFEKSSGSKEIVFHKNRTDGSSSEERRNYNFYWSFESCWAKKIKDYHKAKSCGSRGSGALTYRFDADHHDHMHISLPVCKDKRDKFKLHST